MYEVSVPTTARVVYSVILRMRVCLRTRSIVTNGLGHPSFKTDGAFSILFVGCKRMESKSCSALRMIGFRELSGYASGFLGEPKIGEVGCKFD